MKDSITPQDIDATIKSIEYVKLGKKMTAAVVTLINGHEVVGLSGCVNPDNYDIEIGGRIALGKAKDQLWPLLGYELQERIYLTSKESSKDVG